MKLTRNKVSALIILVVVLAVFNVIAFAAPFTRGVNFWFGYGCNTFAILFSAGVALYAIGREGLKSRFYGVPQAYLAWVYLIVQLIFGFICMVVPAMPFWIELVISVVLLAATLIGLVGTDMGKEAVTQIDRKVAEKVFYIRSLQDDVEAILGRTAEPSLKKPLKDLADAIRYSDPMSSEKLAIIENNLEVKVQQISQAAQAADTAAALSLVEEAQLLLIERNKKCKMLKGM